jgi:23S rRNA (cytosine1962-C5)-methyltransferase
MFSFYIGKIHLQLMLMKPSINLLVPIAWQDYELLDSGNGAKLERYARYRFVRPAPQAVWSPSLNETEWQRIDGAFQPGKAENGGHWKLSNAAHLDPWEMVFRGIKFFAYVSKSRHMGVFPEQAPHWEWISQEINQSTRQIQVLNLFGYTGIATLVAAQAGAKVTHVDASKHSIRLARENQNLAGMNDYPIRWIVDDVLKFVQREVRRGIKYDAIIMDPPKFGRGPKGEVWEFFKLIPYLLESCRNILSGRPLFIVITAYAIQASSLSLYYSVESSFKGYGGELSCGELALQEKSAGRLLPMAIYVRWNT